MTMPLIWTRRHNGYYTCYLYRLVIWRGATTGRWYLDRIGASGDIDATAEPLGWSDTLVQAKARAEEVSTKE